MFPGQLDVRLPCAVTSLDVATAAFEVEQVATKGQGLDDAGVKDVVSPSAYMFTFHGDVLGLIEE